MITMLAAAIFAAYFILALKSEWIRRPMIYWIGAASFILWVFLWPIWNDVIRPGSRTGTVLDGIFTMILLTVSVKAAIISVYGGELPVKPPVGKSLMEEKPAASDTTTDVSGE